MTHIAIQGALDGKTVDRAVVQVERLRDDISVAVLCCERKITMSTIKEIMQIGVGMPDRETSRIFPMTCLAFRPPTRPTET